MGFNAYKCERCGKYYDNHYNTAFDRGATPKENFAIGFIENLCEKEEIELCDTCIREFGKWFEVEKVRKYE